MIFNRSHCDNVMRQQAKSANFIINSFPITVTVLTMKNVTTSQFLLSYDPLFISKSLRFEDVTKQQRQRFFPHPHSIATVVAKIHIIVFNRVTCSRGLRKPKQFNCFLGLISLFFVADRAYYINWKVPRPADYATPF